MTAAIELRNIKKSYADKAVLENFNLAVEKGEFLTVVGSSGCGKTTLLKMINGLIKPTEGDILIDGEDICGKDMIQLRRNIGYAIQGSILFPHMSVEQNIAYVPNLLNKKNKEKTTQAVKKWMKIVGLEGSLSGRTVRRAAAESRHRKGAGGLSGNTLNGRTFRRGGRDNKRAAPDRAEADTRADRHYGYIHYPRYIGGP